MRQVLRVLLDAIDVRRPLACCQLVESHRSARLTIGAMLLVFSDGSQLGSIGGDAVDAGIKRRALKVLSEGSRELAVFDLDDESADRLGSARDNITVLIGSVLAPDAIDFYRGVCIEGLRGRDGIQAVLMTGRDAEAAAAFLLDPKRTIIGSLGNAAPPDALLLSLRSAVAGELPCLVNGFSYFRALPRCHLLIFGISEVGKAVAELASKLDFSVSIFDGIEGLAATESSEQWSAAGLDAKLAATVSDLTYVLVVTRNLDRDRHAMKLLVGRGAAYIGMIGNKRKIRSVFASLRAAGAPQELLEAVHAPVGIDIGSQTAMEIAVSIAAELVAHRNLGKAPCRPDRVRLEP